MVTELALAPWFAFAGKAFLSCDAAELLEGARELEDPHLEEALRGDPMDLRKEYARLFLGPEGAPCPPWQSAHDRKPRLMGPSHFGALGWFRTAEVEPRLDNEPADHVGLLLLFFAHQIESGVSPALLEYYYHEHLAWIPDYCVTVRAESRHPFYSRLARMTQLILTEVFDAPDSDAGRGN